MKRVIITWWSNGLWLELSNLFLAHNVEIICLSRNKSNNNSVHIPVDLTREENINWAIDIILEKYQDFDALILCAWGWFIEEMDELDSENINDTIELNLTSNIKIVNKLFPVIKKNESDIVVVWATIWYKANKFMPVYSIAKWWLRGFVENIRDFCKWTKSRVLHVSPGWMNTKSNIWPEWRETIIAQKTGKVVSSFIDSKEVAGLDRSLSWIN